MTFRCCFALSPHRVGRIIRDPLLPRWFTTYRPRYPVAPNTVDVIPLMEERPPVPLLSYVTGSPYPDISRAKILFGSNPSRTDAATAAAGAVGTARARRRDDSISLR